jgi:hypothetical protein
MEVSVEIEDAKILARWRTVPQQGTENYIAGSYIPDYRVI